MRVSSRPALSGWPLLAALVALCGCRAAPPPSAPTAAGGVRVVLARTDAEPDLPPVVVGDSLLVRLVYGGGCHDHAFALDPLPRGDTLLLRLRDGTAAPDTCAGSVYDEQRLPLPAKALRHTGPLVLIDGTGEAFPLR